MRPLLATWKRYPFIGLLAALSVAVIPASLAWTTARVFVLVVTGEMGFVTDFSYYYEAAERFVRDPLTLYPDPFGFMYPPLSVLLFLPLLALPVPASFLLSVVGIAVLAAACVELTIRLYERARDERIGTPLRVTLLLIGFATAPVFHNLKYGQVNVLVLFLGLVFLWLLQRDRPLAAALVLSVGFWLKLYPLALCLIGLRRGWAARGAVGLVLGIVVAPLVLLPFVPAELYRQYVFDLLPYWSGVTNTHALNQSITGVLEHIQLPLDTYLLSRDTPVGGFANAVNAVVLLGGLGGLYGAYFLGRLRYEVVGVAVLAVLPVVSALGWEHTYVLALPLYLYALLEVRDRGPAAQAFVALAVLVFMIPKPPEPAMVWTFAHWPRLLVDVFYARFLIVTLVLLGVVPVWMRTRRATAETQRAPAA
ncbi:MAG: glycosyltransferase family 87 protein [Rhodothermales bacterium]